VKRPSRDRPDSDSVLIVLLLVLVACACGARVAACGRSACATRRVHVYGDSHREASDKVDG
jgi:hypothetical protein